MRRCHKICLIAFRFGWPTLVCMVLCIGLVSIDVDSYRAEAQDRIPALELKLSLRPNVELRSHLIRLCDICEVSGSDTLVQALSELPFAPAPHAGTKQKWLQSDIERLLALRGVDTKSIRWSGPADTTVYLSSHPRDDSNRSQEPEWGLPSSTSNPGQVFQAYHQSTIDPEPAKRALHSTAQLAAGIIESSNGADRAKFTPAFTNPNTITQAERLMAAAIDNYLQTKTQTNGKWTIQPLIPAEIAKSLVQRRQIIGVAGGHSPWDGDQEFQILLQTPSGETAVPIRARVRLPDLVVAAKRPLAKGRLLREEDLELVALPKSSTISIEDCVQDLSSLIGKQLKRAISTQQPIRKDEFNEPAAIQAGELVTVNVVSGPIVVTSPGRAIESGAIDDVVLVEVLFNNTGARRTRLAGRVVSGQQIEVIANGASTTLSTQRNVP